MISKIDNEIVHFVETFYNDQYKDVDKMEINLHDPKENII